jgi:hypothetical protein
MIRPSSSGQQPERMLSNPKPGSLSQSQTQTNIQKGEDYVRGLASWLKAPNAPYRERLIARSLADDLLDALGRRR